MNLLYDETGEEHLVGILPERITKESILNWVWEVIGKSGEREIEKIERVDLEAFIEQEQDRGLRISTVRTRLACIRIDHDP